MTIIASPAQVVPRASAEDKPRDWLATAILYLPLFGVTIVSKYSIDLGSELIVGVPIILGTLLLGVMTGRLRPHPRRFAVYLMLASVMAGLSAFAAPTFVLSSLILLLCVPLAHAFELRGAGEDASVHTRRFLDFALFICLIGIAQYLLQFVIGQRFAYPIEHFPPPGPISVTKAYNTLNPVRYGQPTLKSNGVFLLEPSYYSQMLALGFAFEASTKRRLKRLACFCAGFVVAYSGTGLVMLAVVLGILIVAERRFEILAFLALAGIVGIAFAKPLGLEIFLDRATEFSSTRSSGYMRYVGGIHLFDQYLWPYPKKALFGIGSGMMFRTTPWPLFFVAETGWVKILIEFGIVGFVSFFGFLFYCAFSARQPLSVRACIAVTLLLSGILDPWSHALILSLLVWMPPAARPPDEIPSVSARSFA